MFLAFLWGQSAKFNHFQLVAHKKSEPNPAQMLLICSQRTFDSIFEHFCNHSLAGLKYLLLTSKHSHEPSRAPSIFILRTLCGACCWVHLIKLNNKHFSCWSGEQQLGENWFAFPHFTYALLFILQHSLCRLLGNFLFGWWQNVIYLALDRPLTLQNGGAVP